MSGINVQVNTMSDSVKLLQQLLAQGKAQGLTQIALARRAGITAEALSRAKKAGDMRVSTGSSGASSAIFLIASACVG